jgi:1-acyl-sn-glycerol-3-phosphate acyltransferase
MEAVVSSFYVYLWLFKVYCFNVIWMGGCLLGAVFVLLPKYLLTGSVERESHEWVEGFVGWLVLRGFVGPVKIVGKEHLPPKEPGAPAPVYIANHASQLDIASVYFLKRRFKWISKKSVVFLPGVGQIMYLSGHVMIDRKTGKNKNSVQSLYAKSNAAVQSGIPMFIFPQGTRRLHQQLPFKDGAFNVALENKSCLVPVSIDIPTDAWNRWYPLPFGKKLNPIILTVHKPIPIKGTEDKEAVKKQCFDAIYSVLPKFDEPTDKKRE